MSASSAPVVLVGVDARIGVDTLIWLDVRDRSRPIDVVAPDRTVSRTTLG